MSFCADRIDECYAVWVCWCGGHRVWRRHSHTDLAKISYDVDCCACGKRGDWRSCHTTRGWVSRPDDLPHGMDDYP